MPSKFFNSKWLVWYGYPAFLFLLSVVTCPAFATSDQIQAVCPQPATEGVVNSKVVSEIVPFPFGISTQGQIRVEWRNGTAIGHWVHITDGPPNQGVLAWVPCKQQASWSEMVGPFLSWEEQALTPIAVASVGIRVQNNQMGRDIERLIVFGLMDGRVRSVFEADTYISDTFKTTYITSDPYIDKASGHLILTELTRQSNDDRVMKTRKRIYCWRKVSGIFRWQLC